MSVEALKEFLGKVGKDETLSEKVKTAGTDGNALIGLGKEIGLEFTAEDMKALKAQQGEELSDEELENVAGGFVTATAVSVAAAVASASAAVATATR